MTQYPKCSFSNHWHGDSWQSVSFTDYLMDKYFESAIRDYSVCHIMKDMSLMTCFAHFSPLSQWAIFVTVWKEKLGKMLIKIWWLDIGVTYELTVCTVWCTVHSGVSWVQWGETTVGFLLCTLETGPYWALSQAAELYSAAHSSSLAGSMFQIVTRCSA